MILGRENMHGSNSFENRMHWILEIYRDTKRRKIKWKNFVKILKPNSFLLQNHVYFFKSCQNLETLDNRQVG